MSLRTIIEINHDFVHAISEHQEEFSHLVIRALHAGNDDEAWEKLSRFGVVKAVMTHHSDARKVVTKWSEYPL